MTAHVAAAPAASADTAKRVKEFISKIVEVDNRLRNADQNFIDGLTAYTDRYI